MEVYIGTILKFSFDFTPKYWMVCHGQILPIKENYTLFSLLENTYGGDGITNFAIPDLRVKNVFLTMIISYIQVYLCI